MLRASSETRGDALDARAITDPSIDPLVEGGSRLIGFVDAVLGGGKVDGRRVSLGAALGSDAVVDASATIANFEMMNRIAQGTGMPVGKGSLAQTEEWRSLIGLDRYRYRHR